MPDPCPSLNDLTSYALGKLPEDRIQQIDDHLKSCSRCQTQMDTLGPADDTFLSALRSQGAADPFMEEGECDAAVARIVAIGREPTFVNRPESSGEQDATEQLGTIGPYQLLAELGSGGMGNVYKALHTRLKRVVALKVLPTDRMKDKEAVARFEREMEAVGRLVHPHIVLAHDAGDSDGRHYLVMELVDGINLSDLVREQGPLPIPEACEIVRQAAMGLQHVYEHGLVHRDIKPGNLMLTRVSTVKLLDLGLARLAEAADLDSELTTTGQAMGTLDYMAPEQGGDSHGVDIRADIWSLGATLYKLLTGHAIFTGEQYRTRMQKWHALLTEDIPSIQSRRTDVPDSLADIVHRMVAREPDDRFRSPAEVVDALAGFCSGAELSHLLPEPEAERSDEPALGESQSTLSMRERASVIDTTPESQPPMSHRQTEAKRPRAPGQDGAQRRRTAVLTALAGFFILAAVFVYRSADGTVVVRFAEGVAADDISVQVLQEGKKLTVIDKRNRWKIHIAAGEYTLDLGDSDDRFELTRNHIIVQRWGQQIVDISLKPAEVAQADDTDGPARSDQPVGTEPPRETGRSEITEPAPTDSPAEHPALAGLRQRVESVTSPDPDDEFNVALRRDLVALQTETAGTPVCVEVGKLMSEISWPVDKLQRDDIPEYELRQLGSGTPNPRGMGLVAGVLGSSLRTQWGPVDNIFWMPGGNVVLANSGAWIYLWDCDSGELRHGYELPGHHSQFALSPDGASLVACVQDHQGTRVRILDPWTGVEQSSFPVGTASDNFVINPGYSADGRFLGIAAYNSTAGRVSVVEVATGQEVRVYDEEIAHSVAFSPDGTLLAAGLGEGIIKVWDIASGELILQKDGLRTILIDVTFSPDGTSLLVPFGESDGKHGIRAYDLSDGHIRYEESTISYPGGHRFAFHPDDKRMWVHDSIRDTTTGSVTATLKIPPNGPFIQCGAFSPDGFVLATGDWTGRIRFWNWKTGQEVRTPTESGHHRQLSQVGCNADGTLFVTGAHQEGRLWQVASGRELKFQHVSNFYNSNSNSWKGRKIVWNGTRPELLFVTSGMASWDYEQNSRPKYVDMPSAYPVSSIFPAQKGDHIWIGGHTSLVRFDTRTEQTRLLSSHEVTHVPGAFRGDGRRFASVTRNGHLTISELPSGNLMHHFDLDLNGVECINFSPDGQTLAITGHRTIVIDAETGEVRHEFQHSRMVVFSPDGRYLAIGSTPIVFDLQTGEQVFAFSIGSVNDLNFTPDSRHLLTANGNGTAYVIRLRELEIGSPAAADAALAVDPPNSEPVPSADFSTTVDEKVITDHPAFEELKQRVKAVSTRDPDDEDVQKLRQDLIAARADVLGQPASTKLGELMSDIPWPVDQLNLDDVPDYERSQLFTGLPQPDSLARELIVSSLGDSRLMHWGPVTAVHWIPDRQTLLSVGGGGAVRLWDTGSGREIGAYWIGEFGTVALSPDGKRLAVPAWENETAVLHLLDAKTGEQQARINDITRFSNPRFSAPAFSPDGRLIAIGIQHPSGGELSLFSTDTHQRVSVLHERPTWSVLFGPDGKQLASGEENGVLRVWDVETGMQRFAVEDVGVPVSAMAFSPDGQSLAIGRCINTDADYRIRVHHTSDGSISRESGQFSYPINVLCWDPVDSRLFMGSELGRLIDADTLQPLGTIDVDAPSAEVAVWHPDGTSLVTGDRQGAIRLWNPETEAEIQPPGHHGHRSRVSVVAVSPDGRQLATGASETEKLWDVTSRQPMATIQNRYYGREASCMLFHPRLPQLGILNTGSGYPRIWDFEQNQWRAFRTTRGWSGRMLDLNASHTREGFRVAARTSEEPGTAIADVALELRQRRFQRGRVNLELPFESFREFKDGVIGAFHPDGRRFASVTPEGVVTVRMIDTGKVRQQFQLDSGFDPNNHYSQVNRLAWSPGGRFLAAGAESTHVVDATTGEEAARFHGRHDAMAFSPDGRLFAMRHAYGLSIYGFESEQIIFSLRIGDFKGMSFTPDSRHLVTANGNGTAYVFRLKELD